MDTPAPRACRVAVALAAGVLLLCGFVQSREGMVSTRDDVRPFTVEERRRILRVGGCLSCRAGGSKVMRTAPADFEATLARRSPRCALPQWP